jgi:DNA-binding response OmpR family regulator
MTDEVLLLAGDATMLHSLERILSESGYLCVSATTAAEALTLIDSRPQITVVVSDTQLSDMSGMQFVDRLNALTLGRARPRVLMLSEEPTLENAVNALRIGVRDFVHKPVDPSNIIDSVRRAMAQAHGYVAASYARSPQAEALLREAEELSGRLRILAYPGHPADQQLHPNEIRHTHEPRASASDSVVDAQADTGRMAILDTIEHLRKLRSHYEHHDLDDVAWDLLLELLRAERMHQKRSVSGLAISISGVSATTSLRRMHELAARNYIERVPDPGDARRDFVTLTPKSHALLFDYLAQANAYLSELNN